MYFICYIPFNIYPGLLLPSLGSRQRNFNKCRISAIYQPAEQNLLNVENIFKDTVNLRECTPENSLNGLFEVQPNYKTIKRMWNALSRIKIVFRFSLQQFKTDDGCFFKRRNRVSNLSSAQFESWVIGLQNFARKFPYSWVFFFFFFFFFNFIFNFFL